MRLLKRIFFLICCLVIFSFSTPIFVQGELEQDYPSALTPEGVDLTGQTSLIELVLIILNWVIIISAMTVAISLIYGGIIYLTSSGEPAKTSEGKRRVFNSMIGLAIIFSAFLILQIINPTLNVIELDKPDLPGAGANGILLLNDVAFTSPNVKARLVDQDLAIRDALVNQLIKETDPTKPQARFLFNSISSLIDSFGEFVAWLDPLDGQKQNFKDFSMMGLHFLPGSNGQAMFYGLANYGSAPGSNIFTGYKPDFVYTYPQCSFHAITDPQNPDPAFCKIGLLDMGFKIPGRSIEVQAILPGIYLNNGSKRDFFIKQSGGNLVEGLNDQVKQVSIRNWQEKDYLTKEWQKTTNYLLALYEDKNFRGKLRLFFEDFALSSGSNTFFFTGNLPYNGASNSTARTMQLTSNDIINKATIELKDEPYLYGRVDKPSSAKIFEIADDLNFSCEIWVCAQPNYGDCYAYLLNQEKPSRKEIIDYTQMVDLTGGGLYGLIQPRNLPKTIKVDRDGDGQADIDPATNKEVVANLRKNVFSIKVSSGCMAVLFENPLVFESPITEQANAQKLRDCLSSDKKKREDNCWVNKSPGSHSEIFTYSAPDLRPLGDGTTHLINQCGYWDHLNHITGQPCASAIAIFPIANN